MPLTLFRCLDCWLWTNIKHFSGVFIVQFEKITSSGVSSKYILTIDFLGKTYTGAVSLGLV